VRQDAEHWLQDGRNDLAAARKMAAGGMYNWAVFAARQAVEKMMKGAFIVLRQEDPPAVHSLIALARQISLEVPEALDEDVRDLSRQYVTTRYPDAVEGVTADAYTQASAERAIAQAERVMEWIIRGLPSNS